jgi:hypothetical protein
MSADASNTGGTTGVLEEAQHALDVRVRGQTAGSIGVIGRVCVVRWDGLEEAEN